MQKAFYCLVSQTGVSLVGVLFDSGTVSQLETDVF